MANAARVLVVGATGNVGREVVEALRARGVLVRAADRRGDGERPPSSGDLERVRRDLQDPSTFAPAAAGCAAVFLMRPPAIADVKTTLNRFVDEARRVGVGHVVFLSVAGAGTNKIIPHHRVEAHLAARGGAWTVLRPGFFAQNLGDAYRRDIVEDARLYVPAGSGSVAFVDVRDVAEVAALALLEPARHAARAYTLTGPEAVTFAEVAGFLGEALGRSIRHVPASIPGYVRHLHRRGLPLGQIAVQTILHVGLRLGQAEAVDPTLATLLGRPGKTLRDYVRDHLALWDAPGGDRAR
jgi:uncharacterized protein YbjT (DUF2867 family)